jgi:hypothetical protein
MIIKSNQWRNYKNNKKRTYNETTYMETVEKVVRDYIAFLKLTDKVRLIIGEQYRVNYTPPQCQSQPKLGIVGDLTAFFQHIPQKTGGLGRRPPAGGNYAKIQA